MIKEPKRLIESEAGPLAQSLAAAQLRLPSQARLAALAERLASSGVVLGEPARPPALRELTQASSVLPPKSLELSLKAVLAALALGVVAIGGALFWRYGGPRTPASSASTTLAHVAPLELAAAAPQAAPAGLPSPAPALAQALAVLPSKAGVREKSEPAEPEAAAAPAEREANAETTHPPPARAPTPVVTNTSTNVPSPARTHKAEAEPKRASLSASSVRSDGAASGGERLPLPANTVVDSEVETLKKARNALSGDPVQAFVLSERCRAQFPSGTFAQEREFIAISALIRMGRLDEARGRASLFRTHYRNSAYLPQLTRMLGEE